MENFTSDNNSQENSSWYETEYEEFNPDIDPVLYCTILSLISTIGLTGNCLILVLFSTNKYSRQSYSVYVRTLAVSDSLVLISTLTDDVITRLLDEDILYTNPDICFVVLNWTYFFQILSSALVLAIAVDRFIVVSYPLRRAFLCTFKRALWLTLGIFITCLALALPAPIWNEIETATGLGSEDPRKDDFVCPMLDGVGFRLFSTISEFAFILFGPFTIVLILNLRSAWIIRSSLKMKSDLGVAKVNPSTGTQIKVTLSLIAVTIASVLVLLPLLVVEVLELSLQLKENESLTKIVEQSWDICNIIQLINYAQNFYIFLVFGREYRTVLKQLFSFSRRNISESRSTGLSVISSQSGGDMMTSRI